MLVLRRLRGKHFSTGRCYRPVLKVHFAWPVLSGGPLSTGQAVPGRRPVQTGGSGPVLMKVFPAVDPVLKEPLVSDHTTNIIDRDFLVLIVKDQL